MVVKNGGFSSHGIRILLQKKKFGQEAKKTFALLCLCSAKTGGCFRSKKHQQTLQHHQEFQVPKMEVLNLIRLFGGWVFPYISLTYSLYR